MNPLNSILVLLATFVVVFCESKFNAVRHLLGAQIDLLPALMVYASLRAGLITMITTALLGGLLFDSLSANPLGLSIVPLFLAGLGIYWKRELILRDQAYAQFVLGFLASSLTPLFTLLLLLTAGHTPLLGWASLWQWIVVSFGGAAATPVLFRFFDVLDHSLSYRRANETSFRQDREIRRGRS